MKKLSVIMAFVIAIFISGNVSAANWVEIDNSDGIILSVDKDSIQRGTESKNFPKFNRNDGFSAIVKIYLKIDEKNDFESVKLISFYKKGDERIFCTLDSIGKPGAPLTEKDVIEEKVDTKGYVWPKVWDYIEKNLK